MKNILEKNLDNRMEILKENFPECYDLEGKFNLTKFHDLVSPQNKTFKDTYSLNWLGKSFARHLTNIPINSVLVEDKVHNSKAENINSENIYIKGDNLEVLRHLLSAYHEKIKMIYIDPPYNTGNGDFIYNDDRKFSECELQKLVDGGIIEEDEKDRILEWTDKESSSHSAWLTFMFPRLYLARKVLAEDGVIFISIDDNEASQLKLLCDEIFGEENFVSSLIWKKRTGSNDSQNMVSIDHEYIFVYFKKEKSSLFGIEKEFASYKNPDNDVRGDWMADNLTCNKTSSERPNLFYPIKDPKTNIIYDCNPNRVWCYEKSRMEKNIIDGKILFPKNTQGTPMYKRFKNEVRSSLKPLSSLLNTDINATATKSLRELMGGQYFDYPKGCSLLKNILKQGSSDDSIILDFFSGSATTAHATMQLNAEDGGNRKYIMVQLEEKIKEKSEAEKFCEENKLPKDITSIGIERIKRAAKKIKEETKADIDYGFKIFSVRDVPNKLVITEKFDPSIKLPYEDKNLSDEEVNAIITTYKVYDGHFLNTTVSEVTLADHKIFVVENVAYIIFPIKSSDMQKALLEKIDSDPSFGIVKIVIYGFDSSDGKYRREFIENVKNYSNRKNASISLEVRY